MVAVFLVTSLNGGFSFSGGADPGSESVMQRGSGTKPVIVKTKSGAEVKTFVRPSIIKLPEGQDTVSLAPALATYYQQAGYNGQGGTASAPQNAGSGQSATNSQQQGGTGDAQGQGSTQDQGTSGDAQDQTPSQDQGGTYVAAEKQTNPYGTIESYSTDANLSNVVNADDFYIDDATKSLIAENNFAVNTNGADSEFFDLYESNRYAVLASFVTVDSMMHTYHLYFSHLLKNTEKGYLTDQLLTTSKKLLEESIAQQAALAGTEWETAATRNVTFFAVACRLLDPATEVPADVATTVDNEVAKINSAASRADCALLEGTSFNQEDYTQYKPRGYYEGDEALERYFRAMMWYGRINFAQADDDLNRSALLMNLALDGGTHGTVNPEWESIYTITSFFAGASDDCTYYEYYPLIQAAYGNDVTVDSLAGNEEGWETFKDLTSKIEAPKISSVIVEEEGDVTDDSIKGFRMMGQRFSLDEAVYQQLVYDNVGDRLLPSTLDVPAAFGSDEALEILEERNETAYPGYAEQMESVRTDIANADPSLWSASLYSQWLYTLNPLLVSKDSTYPSFMANDIWDRKNLQSYLGSYTELKHDTVLYSKQILAEMGGGEITQDDRGYVEPEPELYARLAALSASTAEGLEKYGVINDADKANLKKLEQLAKQLEAISIKELKGETLSSEEYDLIRSYGGQLEHFWDEVNPNVQESATKSDVSPSAVVVDIATNGTEGTVLETATGRINPIYVVVPIDGELHLCKGGVWSYYEFEQPMTDRLTDSEWRAALGIGNAGAPTGYSKPEMVEWVDDFTIEMN